jgi:hypothetical protein
MRFIYILCLFMLGAGTAKAQFKISDPWWGGHKAPVKSREYWRADVDTGKLYFRMSPAGLIDFLDHNITIGAEYRMNPDWSGTMDAGYIFFSQYPGRVKSASGILLRPGIRKYTGRRKDFFLELQLHYKFVNYRMNDWIDKYVVNDVASYEEHKTFRYRKRVIGWNFMIGGREFLSRNRRWFFEVYGGIGLHYKREGLVGETNSRYTPRMGIIPTANSTETSTRLLPAVPFGIRIVHTFR